MSRKLRITIFAIAILLLWWLSCTWLKLRTYANIREAASEALSEVAKAPKEPGKPEKPAAGKALRFESVSVNLDGQDLYLEGSVRSPRDKADAEDLMRNLHVPFQPWPIFGAKHGNTFSPLNNVFNNLEVVSASGERISAWAALASQHGKAVLRGEYPDEAARKSVADAVAAKWPETKEKLSDFRIEAAAQASGETSVSANSVPDKPAETLLQNGWFALALQGKPWVTFSTEDTDAASREKAKTAEIPWNLVENQRFLLAQGQKPAPYAILSATAGTNSVRLEGEVAAGATKTSLNEAATKAYPGATVQNNVVVSSGTRHVDSIGETATTFPPLPVAGAPAALGTVLVGEKWTSQPAPETVMNDVPGFTKSMLGDKIKGTKAGETFQKLLDAIHPPKPTYAILGLTDKKALMQGVTKDEATKQALMDAAKKAYPNLEIDNQVKIESRAAAVANLAPTATSFPAAPAAGGNPWLAITALGNPWSSSPRDTAQLASPATATSGLAMYAIPQPELMAALEKILPTLRASLPPPAPVAPATPPADPNMPKPADAADAKATPAPDPAPTPIAVDPSKFPNGGVEEPLLSLFGENKILSVSGEIGDDATKAKVMDALKAHFKDWTIKDELAVSKFVKPVADATPTLSKLKDLPTDGSRFTSTARVGQAPRKATIHSIYFSTGKFEWSRDRERALAQAKRILALAPTAKLEISGHTDNVGGEAANVSLGQKRAEMLRDYFVEQGIAKDKLLTRGAGPKEPLAPNTNDAGKAQNRRVDLVVK